MCTQLLDDRTNATKNHTFSPHRINLRSYTPAFVISLIAFLPFIILPLYSIDDYFLYQLPDINTDTLGYNFYSVGRFLQALIADTLSFLNLQPLTRPIGPLLFLIGLLGFGVLLSEIISIKEAWLKNLVVSIFATNPFYAELLHYSIIPIYSFFAILPLIAAIAFSQKHLESEKKRYIIISTICYIASLSVYQIFYPITCMAIFTIYLAGQNTSSIKHPARFALSYLAPCAIAFLAYTIILKITFYISPPQLPYNGTDIGSLIKAGLSQEYWILIFKNAVKYLYQNNAYSSISLNIAAPVLSLLLIVILTIRSKSSPSPYQNSFRKIAIFLAIIFIGTILSLGLSVLRPNAGEISGRSFMAHGIVQLTILIAPIFLFFRPETLPKSIRTAIILLATIIIFSNTARYGKIALNQFRLNEMDKALANRIVSRLETHPEFEPNIRILITGQPHVGSLIHTGIGDYNISALQLFSRVNVLNEISGYNFIHPIDSDHINSEVISDSMPPWPALNSIIFKDGAFIIKLSN